MLVEGQRIDRYWMSNVIKDIKAATKRMAAATGLICGLMSQMPAVLAQVSTVPAPTPVQTAPLAPPPGATVQPDVPATPVPAPSTSPEPAAPAIAPPVIANPAPPAITSPGPVVDPNATMAGKPGDTTNVDTLVLTAKPALVISGQSTWDKGFETLTDTFRRLDAEAARIGLKVAGRPLTYFAETDDMGFRFDAMLPVDRAPEFGIAPGTGIRAGQTPQGNAMRFTHKGPYEDVDTTYEGITAYLDAKGMTVRDQFIEEYVNEPRDADDPNLEINIYVQPR